DLAGRIALRNYYDQLPPLRDLAKEYGVSLRTVQNAVELLCQRTLVISDSTRGIRILRHPANKVICVFCNFRKGNSNDELIRTLRERIEADGYEVVFVDVPAKVCTDPSSAFWRYGWADGYISLNGTTDYLIDRCLKSFQMNVLAANRADRETPVSCVDFDHVLLLRQLVGELVRRGYRHIALSFTICSRLICDDVLAAFAELQREHGLVEYPQWRVDPVRDTDITIPREARIADQFRRLLGGVNKPEAIICYHKGMRFVKALVGEYGLELGTDLQLLGTGYGDLPSRGFIPVDFSYVRLAQELWATLRQMIQGEESENAALRLLPPEPADFSFLPSK
ncbi:MAG: LacI family DNA-binding transcriptional regulator, partial [Victivallales bacterium]|nr:LacI family DNA-binding transcriptional regulator [Victivallales bacterium]